MIGTDSVVDAPAEQPANVERNWLLTALTRDEYEELLSYLETVTLQRDQRLGPPHEPIPYVYFPQSGVVSIIKRMRDGAEVEVGTVGAEGMTGLAVALGGEEMPTECVVQIAGTAKRIKAPDLQALLRDQQAPVRQILFCYAQYLFDQVAQSVACDRLHSLEQRCARWLLMTHDRVGASQFELTHEHLASLLGVRRAGVTEVARVLQQAGAVEYRRGRMHILDRAPLEAMACECYQTMSADFDRLLGRAGRTRSGLSGG